MKKTLFVVFVVFVVFALFVFLFCIIRKHRLKDKNIIRAKNNIYLRTDYLHKLPWNQYIYIT